MWRSAILALAVALVVAAPAAGAGAPRRCGQVRVNQSLKRDEHGRFGAFAIRARGTGCRTGRTVARRFVQSPSEHTTRIHGWTCTPRSTRRAQEARVTCRRGRASVTFRDEIPNG